MSIKPEGHSVPVENTRFRSSCLDRDVYVDYYLPPGLEPGIPAGLLLINDGQDLDKMHFGHLLGRLYKEGHLRPLICVGIHAGLDRRMEYGTQHRPDYKERGARAPQYTAFITQELLPRILHEFPDTPIPDRAIAGFSLGGLSALDIAWNQAGVFSRVGVFSGSLWWRSRDQNDPKYDDDRHRIMHQQIRNGSPVPGLRFYLQCGSLDETKDRNHNGIIDSVDDTIDLVNELVRKGYDRDRDIVFTELKDGRHDIYTWGRAMPAFLKWGWQPE
jgi:enterochelin esterase-like enzyme